MYHIIANSNAKSGEGKKTWLRLKKALDNAHVPYIVHHTKSAEDTTDYTRRITAKRPDAQTTAKRRIIVLGGDGTLNCVINGIEDTAHTELAYYPAGTSNDFARAMHYGSDPAHVVSAFSPRGISKETDIGEVTLSGKRSKRFAVSCGIGYDAAICAEADSTPAKKLLNLLGLGKLIYVSVALKQLINLKPVKCRLYLDDENPIVIDKFYFAACMQQPCEGGGFYFCPRADCADGMLDICAVGNISKLRALSLFPLAADGKHIGHKGVSYYRCKRAVIETETPQYVHTDGEVCGKYDRISLCTLPSQITWRLFS